MNDLKTLQPALANEWDFDKNKLLPINFTEHSNKMVFWKLFA